MKNLWIFNHDACSPSTGPMLRHYNFAKYLHAKDYNTLIFASNRIHSTSKVISTENKKYIIQEEDGEQFVRIQTPAYVGNGRQRIKNWIAYYRTLLANYKEIVKTQGKPDVIIGSSVHPLACLAAIKIAK